MAVMLVDESRDRAPLNNIHAPAVQHETGPREIAYRESKFDLGIEPSFDDSLIVRSNAGHVAWLERAQMCIDNFSGKFGLVIVAAKLWTHSPQYHGDHK